MKQGSLSIFGDEEEVRLSDAAEILSTNDVSVSEMLDASDAEAAEAKDVRRVADRDESTQRYAGSLFEGNAKLALENPKHEQMLQAIVAGVPRPVAYQTYVSRVGTHKTATQQASRLLKRPAILARLRWLISSQKKGAEQRAQAGRMTKADKLALLETIAQTGNPADRVRAIQEHNRLSGDTKNGKDEIPDPAFLADYLRRAAEAARDPVAWANELKNEASAGPEPGPGEAEDRDEGNDEGEPTEDDSGGQDPQQVVV